MTFWEEWWRSLTPAQKRLQREAGQQRNETMRRIRARSFYGMLDRPSEDLATWLMKENKQMKIKLTFKGPNVVADTVRSSPIGIGHGVSFTTALIKDASLEDAKRFFEMERTFNELTTGRVHVEILEGE